MRLGVKVLHNLILLFKLARELVNFRFNGIHLFLAKRYNQLERVTLNS